MRMLLLGMLAAVCTGLALLPAGADDHEYAPIERRALEYRDWTFGRLEGGAGLNLREWAKGKRLVLVVYYAPWCGNWHYEAPVVARLYE